MTTSSEVRRAGPLPKVSASGSGEVVRLFDEELFGERIAELGVELLRRIFALEDIASVQVDRAKTTAWVYRAGDRSALPKFLEPLAVTIRLGHGRRPAGPRRRELARRPALVARRDHDPASGDDPDNLADHAPPAGTDWSCALRASRRYGARAGESRRPSRKFRAWLTAMCRRRRAAW